MNVLLLISFILLLLLSYTICNRELCNPSVVFCAVYCLSIVCAFYSQDLWDLNVHWATFLVLVGGALIFVIIGQMVSLAFNNDRALSKWKKESRQLFDIKVSKGLCITIVCIDLILISLFVLNVSRIASRFGSYSSVPEMLELYRANTSYSNKASMPMVINQGMKFVTASAYVFLMLYCFNVAYDVKNAKRDIAYLIPVGCEFLYCMSKGTRISMLEIIGAAAFLVLYIRYWKKNWDGSGNIKVLLRIIIVICLVLSVFYFMRVSVGRLSSEKYGLMEYISMYAGGSIKLLDMYIQQPAVHNSIPGFETFYGLISNLNALGIVDFGTLPVTRLEFRYVGFVNIGNVYTVYRRWIADFGFTGMILLQALLSLIYHIGYFKLRQSLRPQFSFGLLIYLYIVPMLMMHSIDSTFYREVFSISFFITLFLLYAVYRCCLNSAKMVDLHN